MVYYRRNSTYYLPQIVPTMACLGNRAFHTSAKAFGKPKSYSPCEKTFVMVKPDGVQRGKIGRIITKFEERGLKLIALKMMWPDEDLVKRHYPDLVKKKFFPDLMAYITSGPVVPMIWEGKNIVEVSRCMIGETDPMKSHSGTIRGDFSLELDRNIVHGSSDVKSAEKEIKNWFKPEEVMKYKMTHYPWVYSESKN